MGLQEMIKENEVKSNREMDELLSEPLEFDSVHRHMLAYVRYRFILDESDTNSEVISEMSEISIKKMLKMQRDEDLEEMGLTCGGSSSKSRKKVLLMIAIRKKLGFMWDPVESANIETITQLAEGVIRHLEEIRVEESALGQTQSQS